MRRENGLKGTIAADAESRTHVPCAVSQFGLLRAGFSPLVTTLTPTRR